MVIERNAKASEVKRCVFQLSRIGAALPLICFDCAPGGGNNLQGLAARADGACAPGSSWYPGSPNRDIGLMQSGKVHHILYDMILYVM
jgi:hypothetical protein